MSYCSKVEDVPEVKQEEEEVTELSIVDKNATPETKALYTNSGDLPDMYRMPEGITVQ